MPDSHRPDTSALHRLAYSQEGLFTARQAGERGFSPQLLAHHARSGRFTRLRRGLYRLSDYPTGEYEEIRAAWMSVGTDRAVVSHESALLLHALSDFLPDRVHLMVSRSHRGLAPPSDVTLHTVTTPLPRKQIMTRAGIAVTTPARSIIDAAAGGAAPDQIQAAIRQAIAEGLTTPTQIAEQASRRRQDVATLVHRTLREAGAA